MLRSYFKMALRSLLKNKVSSIINISGLAVGLATGIIILLVIADEFSYDQFNKNLRDIRLLMKNQYMPDNSINTGETTPGQLAAAVRAEIPEIKYAARFCYGGDALVGRGDKTIYLQSIYADPDFFNMMTLPSIKGNPAEALQEPGSVILTESAAKKIFGNDDPVGKTITHNVAHNLKVAAVIKDVPQNSSNRFEMALSFRLFETENDWLKKWDDNRILTWIQVKPLTNDVLLNAKLKRLFLQKQNENIELFAYPFAKMNLYSRFKDGKPVGGLIDLMLLLSAIAAFVLLIACINFMNLATARSEKRAREVGVRKVMGASRKLLILQFMGEALLLSFIALVIGAVLANIILPLFMQLSGKHFSPDYYNWRIWALMIGLGVVTGIVAGSYPALYLSRFQPVKVLKKLMTQQKGGGLFRKSLVTFQFMISTFLIIGTVVIFKQIQFVQNRPVGYNQENLIDIPAKGKISDRIEVVKNELLKINGVTAVTAASDNLIGFGGSFNGLEWPGKRPDEDFRIISTQVEFDWIKTAGLQLTAGRDFSAEFGADSLSCLINEEAVKKMHLQHPLGTKLGNSTVVGVIKNFVFNNPTGIIGPMIVYHSKTGMSHFLVRINNNSQWRQCIAEIEKAMKRVNPNFPFEFSFIKDDYQQNFRNIRSVAGMTNSFGIMAIFISCLGLFGLSAFLAERRRKEISVRKVLGAGVGSLWYSLSASFVKPVIIAFVLTAPLAGWAMQKVLNSMEYHTSLSWWMFAASGIAAIIIAIGTVSFHSLKAAKANPVVALQSE